MIAKATVAYALLLVIQLASDRAPQDASWILGGSNRNAYAMQALGSPSSADGATIQLSAATDSSGFGSAGMKLPADAMRAHRVRLSAELRTSNVSGGASLWLRVDKDSTMLLLDNGVDSLLKGTADWTTRSISLPVPQEATTLVFGVLLRGKGEVTVRNLRLDAGSPLSPDAPIAKPAKKVLDEALQLARQSSLHRKEIDWSTLEPRVRAMGAGAATSAEVYPAIRFLLSQLRDHHSFFSPPVQSRAFAAGGAGNPAPEVRGLKDGIGYISVPGYSGGEPTAMQQYARTMFARLAYVAPGTSCGWVVDLRTNSGGNMWPMLAGLKPLLGNAGLGRFVSPDHTGPLWVAGQGVGVEPPVSLLAMGSAYVAVLTGPRTASSGEAVTIAFRGRANTRSFGLPTNGLSTANSMFPLSDGSTIVLTTAVEADRTGKTYGEKVDPDERVEAGGAADADSTLNRAVAWLRNSPKCK